MIAFCNRGNPSSSHAREAKKLIEEFREEILGVLSQYVPKEHRATLAQQYKVIYTSGASESNCMLIRATVLAYKTATQRTPHVICTAVEHKSILLLLADMLAEEQLTLTLLKPNLAGQIEESAAALTFQPDTCLFICMHANNETGAINNIQGLSKLARDHNVPFFSDTVQTFGKIPIPLEALDALSISFHKIHGAPGVGALVVKKQFWDGFHLKPLIYGTQNDGARGGTENLPGIAAARSAVRYVFPNMLSNAKNVNALKREIVAGIAKVFRVRTYEDYMRPAIERPTTEVVLISQPNSLYLPGTLLLSLVKTTSPYVCNAKLKAALEAEGVIVSIGSACNTSSQKASHVLEAMMADEYIKKGTLRISLSAETTIDEAHKFVSIFVDIATSSRALATQ